MDKLVMILGLGAASFFLIWGGAGVALADNIVGNTNSITMFVDTTNSELKIKDVATSASDPGGDPVDGCNIGVKNDDILATVTLSITPDNGGLTATPNPVIFDECGQKAAQTITLAATIGGTYEITASAVDNDPADGVFHYPIGTITVTVIDNVPPDTTITSRPNNPTANQSATFTFSSNEGGSTFECSLDGSAFAACTSPTEYTGLAVGGHTFNVTATDPSGNTDQSPASFMWTIKEVTIDITSVTPAPITWGSDIDVQGDADTVDLTLAAELDWGDGTITPLTLDGNDWGPETHSYAAAGTYTITASLKDGGVVKASASESIVISTRNAILDVSTPQLVTGETKFVANGTLKDASTLEGIDGLVIEFSGDGAPDDVTTQGVGFFGVIDVQSCQAGESETSECMPDDIGDASTTDNKVLHLDGKITFPQSTSKVRIVLQDMGNTPFTYTVIEYPDTAQECPGQDPGVVQCPATSFSDAPLEIIAKSGTSVIGGVTVYNGIKEISFSPGVEIGVSALETRNEDSNPTELHQINFDNLATGPRESGFTVDSGFYFAFGVSQFEPENGLTLVAKLASNPLYVAPDASATYNVVANLQSAPGVGGESVQGSGTNLAKRGTGSDLDDDGLNDTDEGNCLTRNPSNTAQTWKIAGATSESYPSSADCPKKGGVSGARPDLYYEVDCMNGVQCPTQADLDLLEKAYNDSAASGQIFAHFHRSDTGLCGLEQDVVAWFDGSSAAGAERCDDFKSIKLYNFGTGTENDGGCTLAGGCGTLIARAQAVGYILIAHGVNNCGTTGLGELYGRDIVVGTDCIFKGRDDANRLNAVLGTILHEVGHNNGLGHGGGKADHTRDDVNCKPNHVSVMSYPRQVPTDAMSAGSASASSAVGWYLGYHRGQIKVGDAGGSASLDENSVVDNKLVMTGTWKNRDRTTTITSFKILWGDNPAVRSGFTGNTLSWDGGASPNEPQIDLNGIPDVFVKGFQLPACTEAPQFTLLNSPPDELVTMKNNMDEFQKTGAGIAALGVGGDFDTDQDPDIISEQNLEGVVLLDTLDQFEFLGVKQPLNNIAFGEPGVSQHKKGNTIPVQFNFKDKDGNVVTGDNALLTYGITRIDTKIALITDFSTPPADGDYVTPQTSNPANTPDFFTWDGSKWSFNMGTKNLQTGGTYTGRIYLHFNFTDEVVILDLDGDTISYIFKVVKG